MALHLWEWFLISAGVHRELACIMMVHWDWEEGVDAVHNRWSVSIN